LAYQSSGRLEDGVALLRTQLSLVSDRQPRIKGVTLRTLAALSDPLRRVPLLREAVALLNASGNRLEEADALTDLGDAYQHAGDWSRARATLRSARNVAKRASGDAVPQRLDGQSFPVGPSRPGSEPCPTTSPELTDLSDAERRVAALAVLGCTNREIAGKLYITVSTVEQHLTRVYRKLRVNRRRELPRVLAQNWPSRDGSPPAAPC
jgi:DNA-binding CsgD family transcriptional regulator